MLNRQGATSTKKMPRCLHVKQESSDFEISEHKKECNNDILHVGDEDSVRQAKEKLGLSQAEIEFIGCGPAPFSTSILNEHPPFRFLILYPIDDKITRKEYLGPVLHELGHVYQLSRTGSNASLMESLGNSIERVEMGADFLAGLALRALDKDESLFESSLVLVGHYKPNAPDSHGTPPNRAAAFSFGYHSRSAETWDSQYADFQDNRFIQIKDDGL
jgi:hypothetical protein